MSLSKAQPVAVSCETCCDSCITPSHDTLSLLPQAIWEKVAAIILACCRRSSSCFPSVHGSLARAGKVKGQTPKVEPQEKKKTPKGRAKKRILYNRRFVNVTTLPGGKRRMLVFFILAPASFLLSLSSPGRSGSSPFS
ncbi:ribosomal protein S30-domain-containing protein [Mycena haematopus]|nr:ribosomal protein S30-domain-containing protein [Mycena haematopus]